MLYLRSNKTRNPETPLSTVQETLSYSQKKKYQVVKETINTSRAE